MSDIKYIKLRTKNAKMMAMYGDKLTKSEWARSMRTNGLHTEIQFSDRYGNISFSSTLSDGCNGCRFKMIGYSHPYRWSTVYIPVTAEQEARLFAKGCEMAGIPLWSEITQDMLNSVRFNELKNHCMYGPNHIQYDKGAAFFSFISKRNIWKPSKTKMICNRSCGEVMMSEWPDMFEVKKAPYLTKYSFTFCGEGVSYDGCEGWHTTIHPHQQTPDDTEYLTRHYFDTKERPTQQDIDRLITDINKELA